MPTLGVGNLNFSLTSHHAQAYELEVIFPPLSEGGSSSSKTFTFLQGNDVASGKIVDIYSLNGVCQREMFKMDDGVAIQKAKEKWEDEEVKDPTILVLDLKDSHLSYEDHHKIKKYEKIVSSFFAGAREGASVKAKDAKKLEPLSKPRGIVDFVLCEGSLKHDLLKYFSPAQGEYLLSKQGGTGFCQCAEFVMNGFKFGQEVKGIEAHNYVSPLSNKEFHPYQTSTVWYPPLYKEMYSIDGRFVRVLKSVFSITGAFDEEKKITSLDVEVPK